MPLSPGHVLLAALVLAGSTPSRAASNGASLSYLKDREDDGCDWVRQPLPSGKPQVVFSFDEYCSSAVLAWSPDGTKGLVKASRKDPEPGFRLWLVDLVKRKGTLLPLTGLPEPKVPTQGEVPSVDRVTFDRQGRPVALVDYVLVVTQPETGPDGKSFISFEGQRYPVVEGPGNPAIVMAYRLEGGRWKRIELKSTSSWFSALETARTLQPVTTLAGLDLVQSQKLPPEAPAQKLLHAAFPEVKNGFNEAAGDWMRLATPGGPLYYRMEPEGDGYAPQVPVRWERGGKLVPVEGVPETPGTSVYFQLQRDLLLISVYEGSSGSKTLILDARTKKLLLSMDGLSTPVLWPSSPSSR